MNVNRYHRQTLLPQIGAAGQEKLGKSRVLLIGCGALGTVIADQLVRAGVGFLRIVDRDIVELTNLQRQVLFAESDLGLPKAIAAHQRLAAVNREVQIEPHVVDVHSGNVEKLTEGVQLVLDGTDNVATRYLVNDVCVKRSLPWVYGACVGMEGRVMPVLPDHGPCLRCIFPNPPTAAELPTCDTAGVLGPAANVVASMQSTLAIKLLIGETVDLQLTTLDLWTNRFKVMSTTDAKRNDCPCCGQKSFEFLNRADESNVTLCGRNAMQVRPAGRRTLDLSSIAATLSKVGVVKQTAYLVRCQLSEPSGTEMTVFPDGRAIISGLTDAGRANALYAKFVGA